ncbi:hypothetical protein [Pseudidiomarina sediminum]|uniref:hypothetical protein n=1 Tax=Pseudidiomarina sediminum TaxID=431675 RepID=UPI001C950A5C|nr:hypothetical protein [Pseudidiomarina sediminum]MBY6062746.1 hypothetical protein [Pseudidiomarina sediminum]
MVISLLAQVSQAVADVHQSHQENLAAHAVNVHSAQQSSDHAPSTTSSNPTGFDCQHCCQCHGSVHLYPLKTEYIAAVLSLQSAVVVYAPQYKTRPVAPLYRPPITSVLA